MPEERGSWVGHYRLLAPLGAGGMGKVALAQAPDGRLAALKRVHPGLAHDPGFRERFRREVDASRRVSGAYTAAVLDADPDAPVPWLASSFIAGPTLRDAIDAAGPLPAESVRRLAVGLATALADIHRGGLIHRDLKPTNVLLAADGPRVIDFGIARAAEGGPELTHTGAVVGSPGFMSPEQALGKQLTPASDVFSLGGLLVLAATGHAPFAGRSTPQTLYQVVHTLPDFSAASPAIRYLAEPCLAKDPAQRPTPEQLLDAIGSLAPSPQPWPMAVHSLITEREQTAARAVREPIRWRAPVRRRRRGKIVAAAAGAVVVVAAGVLTAVTLTRPDAPPTTAADAPAAPVTTSTAPPEPLSPAGLRQIDPCQVLRGLPVTSHVQFTSCVFSGDRQREITVGVPTGPIPADEATATATIAGLPAAVQSISDGRNGCDAAIRLPDDPDSALRVGVTTETDGATDGLCDDAKAKLTEMVQNIRNGNARLPEKTPSLAKLDPCTLLTGDDLQKIFGTVPTGSPFTLHGCGWYLNDSASLDVSLDYFESAPFPDETRGTQIRLGGVTGYVRPFSDSEPEVCEVHWTQRKNGAEARETVSVQVTPPADGRAVDTCRQAKTAAAKVVPRLPR
ncbi:hypothetical protein GCM10022222_29200 [Amycolatopsis ultiminotia]|uniref:Protein kinase domain-containing protein n=1 Tax=Amycolatopsis ultiminotia TaxID=543629 RepID=A0ABP6W285_9PSEU